MTDGHESGRAQGRGRRRSRLGAALSGVLPVCLCVALAVLASSPVGAAAQEPLIAFGARVAGDDARTRVVVEFDRKPHVAIHYVSNPYRVIVDLPETVFGLREGEFEARGLFSDIRYGSMGAGNSRIVLTADNPVAISATQVMSDEAGDGFRLVLDAEMATPERFAALIEQQTWSSGTTSAVPDVSSSPTASDQFVIAIDPGHGGIDTGAVGVASKTPEKDVTLAFARELSVVLKSLPGVLPVLTRDGDQFLSLSQRVQIARHKGADLLISLHADTLRQTDIRGATIYTISDKASDHLAASLAERENLSDEIAGVALESEPPEVTDILIDLTRRETQAFSVNLARSVVASFEGQINLINNPHRHAGFRVLQAPDVPSILLELGFLSNAEDETLLLDPAWRAKVSARIADAIARYRAAMSANGG